jgi:hypothetical protein
MPHMRKEMLSTQQGYPSAGLQYKTRVPFGRPTVQNKSTLRPAYSTKQQYTSAGLQYKTRVHFGRPTVQNKSTLRPAYSTK